MLGNMLSAKGILRAGYGNKEKKGKFRAGLGLKILDLWTYSFSSFNKFGNAEISECT